MKYSVLSLLLLAGLAKADSITVTGYPPAVSSVVYFGYAPANDNTTQMNIGMICDEFNREAPNPFVGATLDYNKTVGLADITLTHFPGDTVQYEQAAILLAGDGGAIAGLNNVSDSSSIEEYQTALWELFSPGSTNTANTGLTTAQFTDINDLVAAVQAEDLNALQFQNLYDNLQIFTPVAPNDNTQEFLYMPAGTTPTPEPASMVLLGGGLTLLGVLGHRRRNAQSGSRA